MSKAIEKYTIWQRKTDKQLAVIIKNQAIVMPTQDQQIILMMIPKYQWLLALPRGKREWIKLEIREV